MFVVVVGTHTEHVINEFALDARINILICQCHTVTNGTDLRRSPHLPLVQRCIYLFMWEFRFPQEFFFVVQKYSNQGVSCKFIQIRVFRAEILVRHRYPLPYVAQLNFLDQTKPNQTASGCTEKWQMAVDGL